MATIRRLERPPITEAIFDFRTRLPAGFRVAELATAVRELAQDYPTKEEAWLVEGSFEFSTESAGTTSSSSRRPNGYFFRSVDGKHVAQFRLDGFTFSRLAPYTSWDEVAPEAFRLWDIYRAIARPEALFRIAVRYINHIRLPSVPTELNNLLTSAPQVPEDLPQLIGGFLTRVLVPLPNANGHVMITQAMSLPPLVLHDILLLDIDVVRQGEFNLAVSSLRPAFEELRHTKNKAFFGSVREELVRDFE